MLRNEQITRIAPNMTKASNADNPYVWHYTTMSKLDSILMDQQLRPSTVGLIEDESPILWFSTNEQWEETANKLAQIKGRATTLTQRETFEKFGGLLRFGIKANHPKLVAWPEIGNQAGTPAALQRSLEQTAIAKGSKPEEWLGILSPLRMDQIEVVQIMMDYGEWFEIERKD